MKHFHRSYKIRREIKIRFYSFKGLFDIIVNINSTVKISKSYNKECMPLRTLHNNPFV